MTPIKAAACTIATLTVLGAVGLWMGSDGLLPFLDRLFFMVMGALGVWLIKNIYEIFREIK